MRRRGTKRDRIDEATSTLTPNRGGDLVGGDTSIHDQVDDPGTLQGNHATRGYGGDEERGDADDAKVKGRSRG